MSDHRETMVQGILENVTLLKGRRILLKPFYLIYPTQALRTALKWIQPDTYSHCRNVESLSIAVGKEYRRIYKKRFKMKHLKDAAFFHDIGKLTIKKYLLRKKGLSLSERRLIRKHPEIGVQRRDNLRADRRIDLRVGTAVKASPEGSPKREDVAFFSFICEMERREECHRRDLRPATRILS